MEKLVEDCEYISNILNSQENDINIIDEDLDYIFLNIKDRNLIFKLYNGDYDFSDNELIDLLEDLRYLGCKNKIIEIMILMKTQDIPSKSINKYLINDYNKIILKNNILETSIYYDLIDLYKYFLPKTLYNNFDFELLLIAKYNSINILKYLIINNKVSLINLYKIFKESIENGSYEILELLLNHFVITKIKFNINYSNDSALISASKNGYLKIVELLLKWGATTNMNEAFLAAIENNHYDIVKLLINKNNIISSDLYTKSVILASKNGYYDIIELLIKIDIRIIYKNSALLKSLLIASKNNYYNIVKLLIENGIDINATSSSDNALLIAIRNNNFEICKLLIDNGINITIIGNQALIDAVYDNNFEIVKLLIENGANTNRALTIASNNGYYEIVKLILENGVDIHSDDDAALNVASRGGYSEIVKLLLENGANVHTNDELFLRLAIESGDYETIKLLLEYGANSNNRFIKKDINNLLRSSDHNIVKLINKYR